MERLFFDIYFILRVGKPFSRCEKWRMNGPAGKDRGLIVLLIYKPSTRSLFLP